MQITIEISDEDAKHIAKWASVSRTLNEAIRIVYNAEPHDSMSNDDADKYLDDTLHNADELKAIEPWLDRLHIAVRDAIRGDGVIVVT